MLCGLWVYQDTLCCPLFALASCYKTLCFHRPLIVFRFASPATDEVLFRSAIPRVITSYHVLSITVLYSAFRQ